MMKKSFTFWMLGIACVVATMIAVTVLCHSIRFRPDQSERFLNIAYSGEEFSHFASGDSWVCALSPKAEVLSDHGIGFRRVEIRQRPDQLVPRNITRHYQSKLGWPQPMFSSGSAWLGQFRESDLPMRKLDPSVLDQALAPDGPATKLHWSGIIFNALTFGLPFLAVATWVPGRTNLAGLVVSRSIVIVVVAWWMCLAIPAVGIFDYSYCPNGSRYAKGVLPDFEFCNTIGKKPEGDILSMHTTSPEEFASRTGFDFIPLAANEWSSFEGTEKLGFSVIERTQRYLKSDSALTPHQNHLVRRGESITAGWPFEAFRYGDTNFHILGVSDLSHLDVQWQAWLANVAILSTIICITCSIPMIACCKTRKTRKQQTACITALCQTHRP